MTYLSSMNGMANLGTICKGTISSKILLLLAAHLIKGVLSNDRVLFSCSFRTSSCGMENQEVTQAKWHRKVLSVGGRNGYALVVHGNEARNHIARIITPNLSTQGSEKGCLRFRYFIEGRKPASLAVIKQGYVTQYVFTTAYRTDGRWEQGEVDVEFLGDSLMFYFEADTQVQEYGDSLVAVTDVVLTSEGCDSHRRKMRVSVRSRNFG